MERMEGRNLRGARGKKDMKKRIGEKGKKQLGMEGRPPDQVSGHPPAPPYMRVVLVHTTVFCGTVVTI